MAVLANLSIGKRLGAGFALMLAMTVAVAFAGIWHLRSMAADTRAMMDIPMAKQQMIAEWRTQTFGAVRRTIAVVRSADPTLADFFKQDAEVTSARATELIKKIEPLLSSEQEKQQFRKINALRKVYTLAKDGAVKAKSEGRTEEAARMLEQEFVPAAKAYENSVGVLVEMEQQQIAAAGHRIEASIASSTRTIAILSAIAMIVGIVCSWRLTRGIVAPIREAVDLAEAVAAGDLTRNIAAHSTDETGALLRALSHMNDSLVRIVADVRGGTDAIHGAAGEIASGNLDLSGRTEQQASALEETAASMEELTSTVKQNAENARQANQLTLAASEVATRGGVVVGEVVATMNAINESARKIVDIITVIDGIAFQTNILALNAAVEAARAGEQGRGFAVVAGEVRTLAQRSAAAAKEIKTLIDDSVDKVHHGSELVDRAGATMAEIVQSVNRVTDIMSEITAASQEQTAGIEQINGAVAQMDQVTTQNAALVEEASAAAASLQEEATALAHTVGAFKLDVAAGVRSTIAEPRVVNTLPAVVAKAPLKRPAPVAATAAKPAAPKAAVKSAPKTGGAPLRPKKSDTADVGDGWEEF